MRRGINFLRWEFKRPLEDRRREGENEFIPTQSTTATPPSSSLSIAAILAFQALMYASKMANGQLEVFLAVRYQNLYHLALIDAHMT